MTRAPRRPADQISTVRSVREFVEQTRRAQGLPDRVRDVATLDRLVHLLVAGSSDLPVRDDALSVEPVVAALPDRLDVDAVQDQSDEAPAVRNLRIVPPRP